MTAQLLDGKLLAQEMQEKLKQDITHIQKDRAPHLAIILVGDNPASKSYVENKAHACQKIGIESTIEKLPTTITEKELSEVIIRFNENAKIDGFMLQLPLPRHLKAEKFLNQIAPHKDIDGLHTLNAGHLLKGSIIENYFKPCTPLAVTHLIKKALGNNLNGKHAVVVGQSNIVGKPTSLILTQEGCTVTSCHSKTQNLELHLSQADIVVVAVGAPHFIQGKWLKKGACIIDVGINAIQNETGKTTLTGDVDFTQAQQVASHITPVPGGVGPMTITMLLENCVKAYKNNHLEKASTPSN